MDTVGHAEPVDFETLRDENTRTVERLAAMGVQLGGIDQQYMVMMLEHLCGQTTLRKVQLAHARWLHEKLAEAEAEVRKRMLSGWLPDGNGAPPNRAQRRVR